MSGVFTFGETLALLTSPKIGALSHQRSLDLSIGGAESNAAIAVSRLGGESTWLGRISPDSLGELVHNSIRAEGVRVIPVRDDGPMSIMLKDRRSAIGTDIHYWRQTGPGSRLTPEDLPEGDIRDSHVLHFTGITPALSVSARATTFAAVEIAAEAGVTVSFDVNFRSRLWSRHDAAPVLRDLARKADIVFVGDDELHSLVDGEDDLAGAASEISAWGPHEVVIKRGALGAVVFADGIATERPAPAVPVVDTVGAGDAFAGGYLAELINGNDIGTRLATGVACGAWAVTGAGDWEAAPRRSDLSRLTSAGAVVR
ncbi:sugar kinase [Microbacterium sp. Bi128]|uniref:sugar kinase n=1 Tax=Microbacterium sp. Bi128 TaxID=2821115 RepID=UPI001D8064C7|nr:sugar kinase [Microbacterium sp. Bi128]CAH0136967.1 2-dehydro-3-deoxygluconokinase [Microbacterium sp. Bi128]